MPIVSIIRDYFLWHYSAAYADIFGILRNYLWSVNHMFSVPEVFKSLFAPFKRIQEEKVNILKKPEDFFANLFVNFIMRIVGFVLRTALMAIALCSFAFVLGLGIAAIFLWTILPALVFYFFMSGIYYLL
ncbi:MAG: hypothetical protein A2942_02580 [Candidatus Lloydbacteria bacterium RIFCSPLOWO2_01_FULL_50_20]|uniref:Uncharacterized protein n=1 Tax=Candidatus Lloydbacteria bacterium RIFCSPLOWO2_01_FULL_50_20 TaxID=1798665 RepID=A0A1G2DF17_9BACT|nr:MAG: hypothetical protein A3C13_01930 [Candidatus Lloydbacteria bacterium RIFCSPHIGHO2_02_FULL_50_11]OGZ12133.1 MAG: hypothetical protein A2942_02580 [Candidatus Lloydbacteria bacterium RIFCSPLOWO2_01_FULL_50_20]